MVAERRVPGQGDRGARRCTPSQGRGVHVPVAALIRNPSTTSSWSAAWSASPRSDRATCSIASNNHRPQHRQRVARENRERRQDRRATKAPSCYRWPSFRSERSLAGGHDFEPTVSQGAQQTRVSREIFGGGPRSPPSRTRPRHWNANDTMYGWAPACGPVTAVVRSGWVALQSRARVDELLPPVPAHAAFGGYKSSGVGRENHRMTSITTPQTKCCWSRTTRTPWVFF